VVYLLFFWTFIPAIAGFIEGILYLLKSDAEFQAKYLD
jgi:TM2 domain-containing membrane protein YozV